MLKKFIFIVLQLALFIFLISLIINNSFIVSFEIKDFIYSISSNFFFIIILFIFVAIFVFQTFYFKSRYALFKYFITKKIIQKEKGYNSFVNGMLALANKDHKKAILESKKISSFLEDDSSLSFLLKSEIFKVEKKYPELSVIYEKMIKNKSTKALGYRGLMEQYLRSEDYHHAFIYGEKLFDINSQIEKIYDTLVNIIAKTNNWQQLIFLSDKALSKKIIDKKICNINKSIAYFEISKIKRFSEPEQALKSIEKAINLRNFFAPYNKFYIDLLIENKKYSFAKKYFKKIWRQNPHPEYKPSLIILADHLQISILELTKYIIGTNIYNDASKILIVEASVKEKKWENARKNIRDLLGVKPTKEVCLLMAQIEEGDTNDVQKYNSWMLRSKNGLKDNVWVCAISNKSQSYWSALSVGGYFNSLEWKKPSLLDISTF